MILLILTCIAPLLKKEECKIGSEALLTLAKIEQNPTILLIKTEQELNDLEHVLDETISLGEMVAIDIETPGQ